jgi:hypothetical protein
VFDIFLALDRLISSLVNFEIQETIDSVMLRVPIDHLILVLEHAAHEIIRDANVESAAWATCENVNVELAHTRSFANRDGRDKPGHDSSQLSVDFPASGRKLGFIASPRVIAGLVPAISITWLALLNNVTSRAASRSRCSQAAPLSCVKIT